MSTIITQRWRLERRRFLRGLGATVALPLLDAMMPLRAAPASARAEARPRRSVFVYIPNGVNVLAWQVAKAGRGYELTEPLRPLEKHREDFTLFSGLHHPNALGALHLCADAWLTAAEITAINGRPYRNSVSCDQLMAETTAPQTRVPSLQLSVAAGTGSPGVTNTLSFSRDGVPLPAEDNPRALFNRLFGAEAGGAAAQRRRLEERRSVLDWVLADARSLRRALGQEDRTKLDEYLHSVREVEVRAERLESWLKVPKPVVDGTAFQRNVTPTQAGEYNRLMYDLMVLALRTDMTRVITYMSGCESRDQSLPELGFTQTRHQLTHDTFNPESFRRLTEWDTFLVRQLAYFLDQLKAVREDGEPLLDRTMVLFGSGMGNGEAHATANLPIILAGGRGLGLRHGQHIDYNLPHIGAYKLDDRFAFWQFCRRPADDKARLTNVFLTMLHKMDVRAEQFVDSLGPVSELLA